MTRELLTGNGAAALGAKLAGIEYLPAFPITPQTEVIETLSKWIEEGSMDCKMVTMESEHSMVTAAGAAAATGVRTFTATSSQGLLYAAEMLHTVTGWRVPFVLVNVSRGLASPITLEPDHNDIMALRDAGFVQIHCSTCQEVLDSMILAYRLSEDAGVRLPVIVNYDGFYLSFTREPVEVPNQEYVDRFLPPFPTNQPRFSADHPMSQGVAVLGGSAYSYFKYQTHLALLNAGLIYKQITNEFQILFSRSYDPVELYKLKDAEYAFLMIGSFSCKGKEAVDQLRAAGWKIGLVRPRLTRPFPMDELRKSLAPLKGVAVIDQNLSLGMGGVLHQETAAALYPLITRPILAAFVGGLGGRDISAEEFYSMAETIREAVKTGETPPQRLLYTEKENTDMQQLQRIAGTHTTSP
ncbi:MAG: pyruvate synthase [Desulfobulbaceae bacterium]|nr:pyruvate synthase [Desulfobulbaceae bacterium]